MMTGGGPVVVILRQLLQSLLQPKNSQYDCTITNDLITDGALDVVGCAKKVYECCHPDMDELITDGTNISECSLNNDKYEDPYQLVWPLVVAAILGCIMAYNIGANDSANSWGSSVGSGALHVGVAVTIGGIMEWLGAIALGYGVSKTIRKGVADPDDPDCWACGFCNTKMAVYMITMLSALIGADVCLIVATTSAMPISTTHSIVGGVAGGTVSAVGWGCLNWEWPGGLAGIIASWVISPVLSGVIGLVTMIILDYGLVRTRNPRFSSRFWLPVLFGIVGWVLTMMILLKSKPTKNMDEWKMALIGLAVGVACLLVCLVIVYPLTAQKFPSRTAQQHAVEISLSKMAEKFDDSSKAQDMENGNGGGENEEINVQVGKTVSKAQSIRSGALISAEHTAANLIERGDKKLGEEFEERRQQLQDKANRMDPSLRDAMWTFRPLLVFVAALESFAHGANDTANATSAFTAVWQVYDKGDSNCGVMSTPVWVMAIAGGCVCLGIMTFGYRVIKTIGISLTEINYIRGFCIEFASTSTVVLATILGFPVSTTHCQVGAVVFVGAYAEGVRNVAWCLFGKIVLTWVLTIPLAGLVSAFFTWVLTFAVQK